MDDTDRICQIVEFHWPDYVDIVGEDAARRIAEDVLAGRDPSHLYQPAPGGEKFDLISIIGMISSAVAIVQFGIEVHDRLRARNGHNPSKREVEEALRKEAEQKHLPGPVVGKINDVADSIVQADSEEDTAEPG